MQKKKKKRKEITEIREKKHEHNERLMRNITISDIWTLFEQEDEDYLKPKGINSFLNNNYIE